MHERKDRATRRGPRVGLALLVASIVVLGGASAVALQNDGGSGTDAGNAPEDALRVASLGSYEGNVTSTDASDWYKYKLPSRINEPVCVRAPVRTTTAVLATLVTVNADDTRESAAEVIITRPTHLGIATPGLRGAFLNVSSDPFSPPGTSLTYRFDLAYLRASQLPAGDGASGTDAPTGYAGAVSIASGCFGGSLAPASGDEADTYSFAAQAGDRIMVSTASEAGGLSARLVDVSGNTLSLLASGDIAAMTLPATGTYHLTFSSTSGGTYVAGLCDPDCGPPQNPCRPACSLLLAES